MDPIERRIASITEDRRASYLWDTKVAAEALNIQPNRFGEWWLRTRGKLIDLFMAQPGETAAELAALIATAAAAAENERNQPARRR